MKAQNKSELDAFAAWAKKCGHYQVARLIENFRRMIIIRKNIKAPDNRARGMP